LVLTVKVLVDSLLAGAERAKGSVAVIDVFRAFTTAAVALANGASQIVMVGTVEEALTLRNNGAAQVCMGEVRGRKPAEFDFGNSPFELLGASLGGAILVQRTSAGTQGIIAAARGADRLYAASLVTAKATARALRSGTPDLITLVAMGADGFRRTDEDELCALHLRNLLEGRAGDPEAVRRVILAGKEAERFRDPARPYLPPGDLDIALGIDRYSFAIRVSLDTGRPVARMEAAAH
jgi:2-phosphosulfolactate phosphatase